MRQAVIKNLNFLPDNPNDLDFYRRQAEAIIQLHGAQNFYHVVHKLRAMMELSHLDDFEIGLLWYSAGNNTWHDGITQDRVEPARLAAFKTVVATIPIKPEISVWTAVAEAVDGSDDMLVTIPPEVCQKLGWKAGDNLIFTVKHDRPYPYASIVKSA